MKFSAEDGIEILRLIRLSSPTDADMNSIFAMYKKYIDSTPQRYTTGNCSTCNSSIVGFWIKLCQFYENNKDKFVN